MRGTKAKMIRKAVYGNMSLKQERRMVCTKKNQSTAFNDPQSLRAIYQNRKKAYLNSQK